MMADLNLHSTFRKHTYGPSKGTIVIDYWYPHTPLARYRTYIAVKVWDAMKPGARQAALFDMRVKASEALTPKPAENKPWIK